MVICRYCVTLVPVVLAVTGTTETERLINIVDGSKDAFWHTGMPFIQYKHMAVLVIGVIVH
jgi:hypothetical protein